MSPTRIMVEVLDPLNPRKDQGNLLRGIDNYSSTALSVVQGPFQLKNCNFKPFLFPYKLYITEKRTYVHIPHSAGQYRL